MLAAGRSVGEVHQEGEITESTCLQRKKQFGGMSWDEANRPRDLEVENKTPKEMVAAVRSFFRS
jgi:hypothetical protein